MIPDEKIEEIKARADIVEVISGFVQLKKKGRNYSGLCPFHSEKTPSFTVNEEKGIFYCFGCHTGGTVITFIMKHESMNFPEALRTLASRYGVTIEEGNWRGGYNRGGEKGSSEVEKMRALNKAASDFFTAVLMSEQGKDARNYLKQRGFGREICEKFSVGYAPDGWQGLTDYLRSSKELDEKNLALAEKAGLVGSKNGRFYDRFRDRLIFPITDAQGRVVGFGGRCLDGSEPKYLNSPETLLFKKAETLYGFYQARGELNKQDSAIVVEGYFDLLALHKSGFENTVATMGTSLTPGHIRQLRRYLGGVYTLFDSDEAGKKAALRSLPLFLEAGVRSRVIMLPEGTDPDDFLKVNGPEAMERAVKSALTGMEFFLRELASRFDVKSPEGKAGFFDESVLMMGQIDNPAERNHYATLVARTLDLGVKVVYDAVEAGRNNKAGGGRRPGAQLAGQAGRHGGEPVFRKAGQDAAGGTLGSAPNLTEATLLKLALRHPGLYDDRLKKAFSMFTDEFLKTVALYVEQIYSAPALPGPEKIIEGAADDERLRGFLANALLKDEPEFDEKPEKALQDCIDKIFSRGKPSAATVELLRQLERSGRGDTAELIRQRLTEK